jgi:hypothetical protein
VVENGALAVELSLGCSGSASWVPRASSTVIDGLVQSESRAGTRVNKGSMRVLKYAGVNEAGPYASTHARRRVVTAALHLAFAMKRGPLLPRVRVLHLRHLLSGGGELARRLAAAT